METSKNDWLPKGLPPLDSKIVNRLAGTLNAGFTCKEGEGVDCALPQNLTFAIARDTYFDEGSGPTDAFRRAYLKIIEARRRELIKEEAVAVDLPLSQFPLKSLPPKMRPVVEELLTASRFLDRAYRRELGALKFEAQIERQDASGDHESYKVFSRNRGIGCLVSKDPYCSALSFASGVKDREQYLDYYPKGMSGEKCKEVAALPNGAARYTAVKGEFGGALKVVPFSEAYGEDIRPAVRHLKRAAELAGFDPNLKNYLLKQAEALLSKEPHPIYEADQAWLKTGDGELFIRFAADEVYPDTFCKRKAHYRMQLGVYDKSYDAQMAKLAKYLPRAEEEAALLIAERETEIAKEEGRAPREIYKARNIPTRALRVVNVIAHSGNGLMPTGTLGGVTLPNWGGVDGEKEAEDQIMILFTYEGKPTVPFYREVARRVFTAESFKRFNPDGQLYGIILHEFMGHPIGPRLDQTLDGKKGTKADAFGEQGDNVDEMKAILASAHMPESLTRWGYKSQYTIEETIFSAFNYAARWLLLPPDAHAYVRAGTVFFGWMIEKGVLVFNESEGKYDIRFDKYPTAARELRKRVLHYYAANDKTGFEKFKDHYNKGDGLKAINYARIRKMLGDLPITAVRTRPIL